MKKDCYFYNVLPIETETCNYYCAYGYCPCEGCKRYITKQKVDELVKDIVDCRLKLETESLKF